MHCISKYRVFSGPYTPVFILTREIYGVNKKKSKTISKISIIISIAGPLLYLKYHVFL